ncbi:TonB-dependent receptor [candidate division KSB1 bacterium]|nr:TonB-dependent receptor [candidate division KSB1 bacterium]
MKRIIFCTSIWILVYSAVIAQQPIDRKIKFYCSNIPLDVALKKIQTQCNVEFIYDSKLKMDPDISCSIQNRPLPEALAILLQNTDISFHLFPPKSVVFYSAQDSLRKLSGIVVDKSNQMVLPQANIILKGTDKGTSTDYTGHFELHNVSSQLCTLQVCYMGYQSRDIPTYNLNSHPIKIELMQNSLRTEPVTIQGDRLPLIGVVNNFGNIQFVPLLLKFLPSTTNNDILHTLQFLPGTKNIFDQLDGLYVQGGTPDQNLVLFDGIPVFRSEHLWGYMNVFNPSAVKKISLLKAGYPVKYGDKLSSVIELEGDIGQPGKVNIGIGADVFSSNGFIQLPITSKLQAALSVRRSLQALGLGSVYYNLEDYLFLLKRRYLTDLNHGEMFEFNDATAKLNYQFSRTNYLALSAFSTFDNIDISQQIQDKVHTPYQRYEKWKNSGIGFTWEKIWSPTYSTKAQTCYSTYDNNYLYEYSIFGKLSQQLPDGQIVVHKYNVAVNESDNFNIRQWIGRWDHSLQIHPDINLEFGIESENTIINHQLQGEHSVINTLPVPGEQKYNLFINLPATFGTWKNVLYYNNRINISNHVEMMVGVRGIYYQALKKIYKTPRLSLTGKWGDTQFNLNVGHYYQFLHRMSVRSGDFNPMRTSYYWALADKNLEPEFARNYSAGLSYQYPYANVGITLYQKYSDNLLFLLPNFTDMTRQSSSYFIHIDNGSGNSKGLELFLQADKNPFSGWIKYQLGKTQYLFHSINQHQPFTADFDRTHELDIVTQYTLSGWNLSSTFILASGTTFSTAEHTFFSFPIESDFNAYRDRSVISVTRLPVYHRVDFKVSNRVKLYASLEIEYGATIFNVFDRLNVIDQYYKKPEDKERHHLTDITEFGRNFFFFFNLTY